MSILLPYTAIHFDYSGGGYSPSLYITSWLLIWLINNSHNTVVVLAQIEIISQPRDVVLTEDEDAFFVCTYHGTTILPKWRINDVKYSNSRLPAQHFYNGSGLVVTNVRKHMNLWIYSCYFEYFGTNGFETLESRRAVLYVLQPSKNRRGSNTML